MRLIRYIINEAAFGNKNLEKAVSLLINVLSGKVGKLYPYGGIGYNFEKFSKSNGIKGIGMIYVMDDGKLVRFNWESDKKSSTMTSIDIWKNMETPDKPDFNLDIPEDHNIVQSIDIIAKFIKSPSMNISEAGRPISPARVKFSKKMGIPLDISTPEYISARGKAKTAIKQGREYIYVKKGVKEKSTRTKEMSKVSKKLSDQEYADPDIVFDDLSELIGMVTSGIQTSLLITGGAGTGKTYTVRSEVEKTLGPRGNNWNLIKGKSSPLGLYRELFINRNNLIVLDDIDSVFKNVDAVNMLKAALDSYDKREISWISPQTLNMSKLSPEEREQYNQEIEQKLIDDPLNAKVKYPNQFEFTGRIIFISNIPASKMDKAIKSRSMVIDLSLRSKDMIRRMESILKFIRPDIDMGIKKEVLNHLKSISKEVKDINLRTLVNGIRCKVSGSAKWKRLMGYQGG